MKKVVFPLVGLAAVVLAVFLSGVLDEPPPAELGGGAPSTERETERVVPDFGAPEVGSAGGTSTSTSESNDRVTTESVDTPIEGGAELTGRVIDSDGGPISGAIVHLVQRQQPNSPDEAMVFVMGAAPPPLTSPENREVTDADGRFTFNTLQKGKSYTLFARGEAWVGQRKPGVKPGETDLVITLAAGDSVTGTVFDPRGRRVDGAVVRSGPAMSKLGEGIFVPSGFGGDFNTLHPEAITRKDGTFVLSGIPIGEFSVVASHSSWGPSEAMNLMQGQSDLQIELRSSTGVAGRVIDDQGEPVAGAKISALSLFGFSPGEGALGEAISGPDGGFQIDGLPPGRVRLNASAAGFTSSAMGRGIQLTEGEINDGVELTLTAAALIRGTVIDEDGAPVANATVRFGVHSDENTRIFVNGFAGDHFGSASAKTDELGAFVIRSVRPDTAEPKRVLQVDHPEYLPFVGDLLSVVAGQEIEVEPIALAGALTLSGRILGPDGAPLAEARVSLHEGAPGEESSASSGIHDVMIFGGDISAPSTFMSRGGSLSTATTDEEGRYVLRIDEPGTLHITARASGFQEGISEAVTVVDASLSKWDLSLVEALQISGVVIDELGVPCADVELSAAPSGGGAPRQGKSDADGRFTIDGLDAGEVNVMANGAGWRLAESIEGVSAGTTDLQVVVLRPGEVTGRIVHASTGQPITRFSIKVNEVQSGDGESRWMNSGFSLSSIGGVEYRDPDGQFLLENLVPGTHRVTVDAPDMVSTSVEVEVASGRTTEVEISVEPAGTIVGRVVDSNGDPIEGVRVNAVRLKEDGTEEESSNDAFGAASIAVSMDDGAGSFITFGGGGRAPAQSDENGEFRVEGLGAGTYKVKFETSKYRPFELPETGVDLGQVTDIGTNTLEKGATIRGTVTLPGGRQFMWCSLRFEMVDPPEDATTKSKRISPGEGGVYELGGLDAGTYEVSARYVPQPDDPESFSFDGSSQRHAIGTVTLAVDDDQTLDAQLPLTP